MDSGDLVKLIKRAAMEAVKASQPSDVVFGTVISVSPLKIQIDQKLTLTKEQLVLSRNVTDFTVTHQSETISVYNGLVVNDKVILLQCSGGQRFIVLDRIGGD